MHHAIASSEWDTNLTGFIVNKSGDIDIDILPKMSMSMYGKSYKVQNVIWNKMQKMPKHKTQEMQNALVRQMPKMTNCKLTKSGWARMEVFRCPIIYKVKVSL
jgi:hypothetical protein